MWKNKICYKIYKFEFFLFFKIVFIVLDVLKSLLTFIYHFSCLLNENRDIFKMVSIFNTKHNIVTNKILHYVHYYNDCNDLQIDSLQN